MPERARAQRARPRAGSAARAGRSPRAARAARAPIREPVRVVFVDVDGTLTDGAIAFDAEGDGRSFYIQDGIALQWARDQGVRTVVISGRGSKAVEGRMKDLDLEFYLEASDKVEIARRVLDREGVSWGACVMIGDDLPDVPLMKQVGWPIAVGDARPEVKRVAKTVVRAAGGRGAVREAMEIVLRHNGSWASVLERYGAR